jgi:photosystem II stability/assembly factor-like uncharacterized protein
VTVRYAVFMIGAATFAHAQWMMQQSHSNAGLRGIYNVGAGVVWASGTQGTVLHTTDDGKTWQHCAVPPGADKLDFRGIQGFDRNIAVVMSSGTGDLSRLYKTSDGCRTWKLVFRNPDKNGFWDALQFSGPKLGVLIGDQVKGRFPVFISTDEGNTWRRFDAKGLAASDKKQSFFAASNTSLLVDGSAQNFYMLTGGGTTALITIDLHSNAVSYTHPDLASGETAGGFSLASRRKGSDLIIVAVGGDYKAPAQTTGTAASFIHGKWQASKTPPHGYRSAVAYSASSHAWITVGPNGTDISMDDGRNWRAIPDGNQNWNALSLPFAAGANGRIGKLNPDVLKP